MNKLLSLFQVLIFSAQLLFGQSDQGGRLTAMGNNGTAVKDSWGTAANPATIVGIKEATSQVSYKSHFFAPEISSEAMSLVIPVKHSSFGLNLQRAGIPEFTTSSIGLIFTKQFGSDLAFGLRVNYHQIKITNYGTTNGFSLSIGAFYLVENSLSFGLYLNNPSKEVYDTHIIKVKIPTSAHLGIAYQVSSKFLIATTINKELLIPWNIAVGLDYQLISRFSIRSAISLMPFKQHVGIGFSSSKLTIDAAFTRHPNFGYSPQITIGYVF